MRRAFLTIAFAAIGAAAALAQGAYYLRSVDYEVRGRSLPYFLGRAAELEEGREFRDRAALDAYLARARRLLLNERVLDSAEIEPAIGPAEADGRAPVDLIVRVKDTWNIIALPYFKYDSNDGLLLSVRARDYNFLGTMLPLRINFNYEYEDGDAVWGGDFDFSYPFPALGLDWSLDFGGGIDFYAEGDNPAASLSLGLNTSYRLGPGSIDAGVSQRFRYNDRYSSSSEYADEFFMTSGMTIGYGLPLWTSPDGDRLNLRPYAGVSGNWALAPLVDSRLYNNPTLEGGAGLSYGTVNWLGNFRDGWRASADASVSYKVPNESFSRTVSGSASYFKEFGWFGISARLRGFYRFDDTDDTAGAALRGILNKRAVTDAAYVVNLDLPVRLIDFKPSRWFDKDWMRLFDFEQHWSPFFDFSQGHYDDTWFLVTKGFYAAGLEVITFPSIMRSFYIRISAGWDIFEVLSQRTISGRSSRDGATIRELFIGLGHHY